VVNGDTVSTKRNKVEVVVPRSKKTLQITIFTDSLTKMVSVKSKNALEYWTNIGTYGIGFLVDKNNPKRYDYPSPIYVDTQDTVNQYFKYDKMYHAKNGGLYWHLSFPYINSFSFKPQGENRKLCVGFIGFSTGLDYFYAKNRFLSLTANHVMDFFLPFPGPIRFDGEWEFTSSSYINFSNNCKIKNISIGYGLSYAKNRWSYKNFRQFDSIPASREDAFTSHNAVGLVFNAYYQMGRAFNIGFIYRPTFIRFGAQPVFAYEHLMSIDFAWKIRLKK
jgi:hypothetical protein